MSTSPLSGVLSPAQIAIIQQARARIVQPQATATAEAAKPPATGPAQPAARPAPPRGRGQIINIVV